MVRSGLKRSTGMNGISYFRPSGNPFLDSFFLHEVIKWELTETIESQTALARGFYAKYVFEFVFGARNSVD